MEIQDFGRPSNIDSPHDEGPTAAGTKLTYSKPCLYQFGDIRDVTLAGSVTEDKESGGDPGNPKKFAL
jgi:hypothetical protein